jgi:hypothetical protein
MQGAVQRGSDVKRHDESMKRIAVRAETESTTCPSACYADATEASASQEIDTTNVSVS